MFWGIKKLKRCKKVQRVRKPRFVLDFAAHLSQLSALLQVSPTHWQGTARDGAAWGNRHLCTGTGLSDHHPWG